MYPTFIATNADGDPLKKSSINFFSPMSGIESLKYLLKKFNSFSSESMLLKFLNGINSVTVHEQS